MTSEVEKRKLLLSPLSFEGIDQLVQNIDVLLTILL
jgi:hypothetical protein